VRKGGKKGGQGSFHLPARCAEEKRESAHKGHEHFPPVSSLPTGGKGVPVIEGGGEVSFKPSSKRWKGERNMNWLKRKRGVVIPHSHPKKKQAEEKRKEKRKFLLRGCHQAGHQKKVRKVNSKIKKRVLGVYLRNVPSSCGGKGRRMDTLGGRYFLPERCRPGMAKGGNSLLPVGPTTKSMLEFPIHSHRFRGRKGHG